MSSPDMLDRERIFDFIILMLYLHYHVLNGPEPNPEWKPLYCHISNFFDHTWDKSIDEVRCKNLWVRIIKDYYNSDRSTTSTWPQNAPAQEPWNDNVAPLAVYTDKFKQDSEDVRDRKKQRIAKVQEQFERYWGSRYNRGLSDTFIEETQKELHDKALAEMEKVPDFDRSAMDDWPAEAHKDHFL
ncbi:MAG: hypothetical protein Q9174_005320 [Haloplaca sp. 1 TL-2023]